MNEGIMMGSMQVRFLDNGKFVGCFYCENYSEMLKFLYYCKKYDIALCANDFMKISELTRNDIEGMECSVKDFWYEFGDSDLYQTICVEIGVGENV